MRYTKIACLILAMALMLALLAGCGTTGSASKPASDAMPTESVNAEQPGDQQDETEAPVAYFPLEETGELSKAAISNRSTSLSRTDRR